jgi:flagellar motor switch protein FliG
MSGLDRAAAVLLVLGEHEASKILKHMDPTDIHGLAQAMVSLPHMTEDVLLPILQDFINLARSRPLSGVTRDAAEHMQKLLVMSVGQERAADIVSRIQHLDRHSRGMEALRQADIEGVIDMVRDEHPQVTAIILSYLDVPKAAEVLGELPEAARADVIVRLANLQSIPTAAAQEITALIEAHFGHRGLTKVAEPTLQGGPKAAAEIVSLLTGAVQEKIMGQIRTEDAAVAEAIENRMFTFDDLVAFDDRGVQALLAATPGQTLKVALKGADDAMRERFLANMSSRAAQMLKDDLEVLGPVRLSEVESAQRELVAVARRLVEAGTIALPGAEGGEELVY